MRDPKDITINGKQLSEILELHRKWLFNEKGGERANLSSANLRSANLSSADLRSANLRSANLRSANLSSANLRSANLRSADLRSADLYNANLRSADLRSADLSSANLRSADLRSADLSNANLRSAENTEWADAVTRILPDGDIIGWKKALYTEKDGHLQSGIIKLTIPAAAKRSNATGRKCRAEYAIDMGHFDKEGKPTEKVFFSDYDKDFKYCVGKTITPDAFDENRWDECSNGVHFFITRYEAEHYGD